MANELVIRVAVFLGVFVVLAALERRLPRRGLVQPRSGRWVTNLALVLIDAAALRLLALALPILAVAAAIDAERQSFGLFNLLGWPVGVELLLAILILDLAVWAQHLITHKVPLFWRFHRVHHADRDFDVTTALRFHPVEIIASAGLKVGLVYLLGPSALSVLIFEILLNATALFNHANLALPVWLDRLVRMILVTPDMHRVHHSVRREEHDSNYGFALSIWDRLFRTYRPKPMAEHATMPIGLEWQDDRPMRLAWVLTLPFRRSSDRGCRFGTCILWRTAHRRAMADEPSPTDETLTLAGIAALLAPHRLAVLGGFHPEDDAAGLPQGTRTMLLLGPAEPGFWPHLTAQPEWQDGQPDPMDRWSRRVIGRLACDLGAKALFPFGGPPWHPFFSWALRTGRVWESPVRLLVQAEQGLMVSFRGALALKTVTEVPPALPRPCETCAAPCRTACPPRALTRSRYDLPACHGFLDQPEGQSCMTGGCLVRRACPVSQTYARLPEQSAYHMRQFHR